MVGGSSCANFVSRRTEQHSTSQKSSNTDSRRAISIYLQHCPTMPKKSEFVLKDSPPEVIAASPGIIPKGRTYDGKIAKQKPGAAKIDEILLGTKLACIAVTDDDEDRLKNVSKLNPWHEVALTTITGSSEEAHKPLTHILDEHFGLKLDHHINISKVTGYMNFVDTQGYIAHNDDTIVVSFRCTTSGFDWLTNFSIASVSKDYLLFLVDDQIDVHILTLITSLNSQNGSLMRMSLLDTVGF